VHNKELQLLFAKTLPLKLCYSDVVVSIKLVFFFVEIREIS